MDRAVPAPGSAASLSAAGSMSYSGLAGRRNGSSTCTCWWTAGRLSSRRTALTETIEGVIQQIVPHADVTVHPEPY